MQIFSKWACQVSLISCRPWTAMIMIMQTIIMITLWLVKRRIPRPPKGGIHHSCATATHRIPKWLKSTKQTFHFLFRHQHSIQSRIHFVPEWFEATCCTSLTSSSMSWCQHAVGRSRSCSNSEEPPLFFRSALSRGVNFWLFNCSNASGCARMSASIVSSTVAASAVVVVVVVPNGIHLATAKWSGVLFPWPLCWAAAGYNWRTDKTMSQGAVSLLLIRMWSGKSPSPPSWATLASPTRDSELDRKTLDSSSHFDCSINWWSWPCVMIATMGQVKRDRLAKQSVRKMSVTVAAQCQQPYHGHAMVLALVVTRTKWGSFLASKIDISVTVHGAVAMCTWYGMRRKSSSAITCEKHMPLAGNWWEMRCLACVSHEYVLFVLNFGHLIRCRMLNEVPGTVPSLR